MHRNGRSISANPFLEIVLCTYNNARLLRQTLQALAEQGTHPNLDWAVTVVDNNSTDETAHVLEQWSEAGCIPKFQYVFEPQQGLTPARLCGVRETTGQWLAFIDDDCLLHPDWIEQAARFAIAHSGCGVFGGKVVLNWEGSQPPYLRHFGWAFAEQNFGERDCVVDCLVGAGLVIRRKALEESGWIRRQLQSDRVGSAPISGGDAEIGQRIRAAGYDMWYAARCELRHVIPDSRASFRYILTLTRELGAAQALSTAMTSRGRTGNWTLDALFLIGREVRTLVWQLRQTALDSMRETFVRLSFVRGIVLGAIRLACMTPAKRRQLVGAARIESTRGHSPEKISNEFAR